MSRERVGERAAVLVELAVVGVVRDVAGSAVLLGASVAVASACGRLATWACGRLATWACGRLATWACGRLAASAWRRLHLRRPRAHA